MTNRESSSRKCASNEVRDWCSHHLDALPGDFFNGKKPDEARAGRIPGAVNRPFTLDVSTNNAVFRFKPFSELAEAYAKLIPSKDSPVVVSCRTGHQASQTYFVLRHLLGYRRVSPGKLV